MDSLNNEQRLAVTHKDGPMMVLAGPGSGKTFVITRRLKYLVNNLGVKPENILVITFTKAAALEMQTRFEGLMENSYCPVRFGTFHAIYYWIIRSFAPGQYDSIASDKEKREILKMVILNLPLSYNVKADDNTIDLLLADISLIKNDGIDPLLLSNPCLDKNVFALIYEQYNMALRANGKVDFDDMVLECARLLDTNKKALEACRDMFKYILIDEFQDINSMQYKVIKLISHPFYNLFIVGDDDQSIYGFRGSKPEIMLRFPKEFGNVITVNLNKNYRSSYLIVQMASYFISNNKNRFKKELTAVSKSRGNVSLKGFESKDDETRFIIKLISTFRRTGTFSDIALIYRTNSEAQFITGALFDNKIPFKYKEKPKSILSNKYVKDIWAVISFAMGERSRSNLFRFLNKPVRYISRQIFNDEIVDFDKILEKSQVSFQVIAAIKKLQYDINQLEKYDLYCKVNYIRKGMGYDNYILSENRNNNAYEVINIMDFFQKCCDGKMTLEELKAYIEDYESAGINKSSDNENEDAVWIVTMHGSKGLEYKNVIIPGLNEGYVPQSKATDEDSIEEERRVFYVAMTRAKENLILTYVRKNKENRLKKSRFINEIIDLYED